MYALYVKFSRVLCPLQDYVRPAYQHTANGVSANPSCNAFSSKPSIINTQEYHLDNESMCLCGSAQICIGHVPPTHAHSMLYIILL